MCVCGGGRLTPNVIGTPTLTGEGRISSVGPRDCNHFWNDNRLRDCKYPRMLRMVTRTSIALSLIHVIYLHYCQEPAYTQTMSFLTLINMGGQNNHPPSENHVFSTTEHPVDLRPVFKLKFVRCGPVENKVREHLFQSSEIEIFDDFH